MNYYEILQVSSSSSLEDIKAAFKKLALLHHPDKTAETNNSSTGEYFQQLRHAYEVLSDLDKRREYDISLANETRPKHSVWMEIDVEEMEDDETVLSYQCRCGSALELEKEGLDNLFSTENEILIQCADCSTVVKVRHCVKK